MKMKMMMLRVSRLARLDCRSIMDPMWRAARDGMVVVLVSGARIEDMSSKMAIDQP